MKEYIYTNSHFGILWKKELKLPDGHLLTTQVSVYGDSKLCWKLSPLYQIKFNWLLKFTKVYFVGLYSFPRNWIVRFRSTYIRELRKLGATVSTAVVIVTARGVIMNKDANLLYSNVGDKVSPQHEHTIYSYLALYKVLETSTGILQTIL